MLETAMLGPRCRKELRVLTTAFTEATGRSLSAISKEYYGKSSFLGKFLDGETTMGIKKYDELTEKIRTDLDALSARRGTAAAADLSPQ